MSLRSKTIMTEISPGYLESIQTRFWSKVDIDLRSGKCWNWQANKNQLGYGGFHVGTFDGFEYKVQAHRVALWLLARGTPEGMHVDHLCKNTSCVNPAHLEVVTPTENYFRSDIPGARVRRTGKCKRGHEYTEENTYTRPNGTKKCRQCASITQNNRRRQVTGE